MAPSHHRAVGKKSRSGCRSCRARRIKCDETPNACRNCTSTGRVCDGYDLHRLPRRRKARADGATPPGVLAITPKPPWAMTSDERQCLSYFQHRTVPTILQFYDSLLWQRLILQMSQSEPAVYHAVVALGAIHQNSEMEGMSLLVRNLYNTRNMFALAQLGRAFTFLTQRRLSHDPRLRPVILVCCLLFVVSDLLQGQYDAAFKHLSSGLRILREEKAERALLSTMPREGPIDRSLVEAFYHLGIQSTLFGFEDSLLPIDDGKYNIEFHTLYEARQAYNIPLHAVYRFTGPCIGLSASYIKSNYDVLQSRQLAAFAILNKYMDLFERFYRTSYARLSRKEQRGANLLYLQQLGLALSLKTCLLAGDPTAYDYYTPDYEMILLAAAKVIEDFTERPGISLNVGVIPILFRTAMACRDRSLRWRAIELLQTWPHREGPFDSNWFVHVSLETLKLELLAESGGRRGQDNPKPTLTTISGERLSFKRLMVKIKQGQRNAVRAMGKGLNDGKHSPLELVGSVKCSESWSCVRLFKIMAGQYKPPQP